MEDTIFFCAGKRAFCNDDTKCNTCEWTNNTGGAYVTAEGMVCEFCEHYHDGVCRDCGRVVTHKDYCSKGVWREKN